MGMMGMFKWLRKRMDAILVKALHEICYNLISNVLAECVRTVKENVDVQRERNGWNLAPKQYNLNNSSESYRNALQAFIDRRRCSDETAATEPESPGSLDKNRADLFTKNNNNNANNNNNNHNQKKCEKERSSSMISGVPNLRASEIFEIGWVPGTEDKYLELIFAEWQNTRVSLKRFTHPECRDAVKADLEVLSEIRHPNVLLLMATTQTDDHGLVTIFESVDCTLYNYIHEQGERISIQGIAKCGVKLCDALKYSHTRGYVHGAISSHCVYLASNGVVKLGGWELAVRLDHPKPEREYEERLRAEIFGWLAPELFYGCEPRKESDVYGLTLLIWEMCTTHVPWSGCNRADVERQYVHWKRGVIIDLYEFPPELYSLLDAGLQLDIIKRTQDMNRMRRFLQRLEMLYEDKEPVYVDQCGINNNNNNNNNNQPENIYDTLTKKSPTAGMRKRITKSVSAKQLTYTRKNSSSDSPSKLYACPKKTVASQNTRSRISARLEQMNLLDTKQARRNVKNTRKNANVVLYGKDYGKLNPPGPVSGPDEWEMSQNEEEDAASIRSVQPWSNNTYRRVRMNETGTGNKNISVCSNTSRGTETTDDDDDEEESYEDARANLRQLKMLLAHRRENFFYGNDESTATSMDTSPRTRNKIFTQARSKDYEPHKPASHKTSLEPKCNKSPGQYDATYLKTSAQNCRKKTYPHTEDCVKDAVMQPQVLHSDAQSFFESSLWRKEKLICISKMSRTGEQNDSTFSSEKYADNSNITDATTGQSQLAETESLSSDQTYIVKNEARAVDAETSRETYTPENASGAAFSPEMKPLRVLKDALDRATKIVRPETSNTDDESRPCSPFKSYENFEMSTDQERICRSVFEDIYNLRNNDDEEEAEEEIRSIERSMGRNETFQTSASSVPSTVRSVQETMTTDSNTVNTSYPTRDLTYTKSFVCDSIAEMSGELNVSCTENDTKDSSMEARKQTKIGLSNVPRTCNDFDDKPEVQSFALRLLNDGAKYKSCNSCNKSALPRRRSLPAALSQLRTLNNSTLGKLPIRRADVPDNTVEDLYIDDEFGDSLNVNMILLQEEILLDEDFLPDISEL